MSKTQPARGMRDFLPADIRKREYVIGIIKEVYESYGFEPLETPAVENLETLTGKYGEEGNQLIFKILKRGEKLREELAKFSELTEFSESGSVNLENSVNSANSENPENSAKLSDLALRYDLTVPLARVVANYKNDLPKFFKRYQIQPVWRADRPARGRFREFYQCDVDAIGSSSMTVEAELISAVCEILQRLGFKQFIVRINHRFLLEAMMMVAMVKDDNYSKVLTIIDKLDKIGVEGVETELESIGLDEGSIGVITYHMKNDKFITLNWEYHVFSSDNYEANKERLMLQWQYFKDFSSQNEGRVRGTDAINILGELFDISMNLPSIAHIKFDPSLARGLSYYTGTIMEINVPDLAGSLGGGGRYDGLIGMFGKEQIPACGFSLGLERILVVMEEREMFPPEIAAANSADVMVTIWNEESVSDALALAQELRSQGLRVLLYPEADKIGKQLKYAGQINVPYVIVQGDEEKANGTVALKNMQTGDQEIIKPAEIGAVVKSA